MAMSSGVPKRPSGVASMRLRATSGLEWPGFVIGVSTKPGWTEFTRILSGAYWIAAALEKMPHRALRGVIGGVGVAADDAADRRDVDDRAAARALHGRHRGLGAEEHAGRVDLHHQVPAAPASARRAAAPPCGWSGCSAWDRGRKCRRCCTGCRPGRRPSRPAPRSPPTALRCARPARRTRGSACRADLLRPRVLPSAALLSVSSTDAPCCANSRAVAAPMPEAPPVTIATLPEVFCRAPWFVSSFSSGSLAQVRGLAT